MPSGFQNPSQNDFVILILNLIKLWYTARSHSGCWAGFFIACSFSRSLCVSCCECINFSSQMRRVAGTLKHSQLETEPMDMPAFTHDWRVKDCWHILKQRPHSTLSHDVDVTKGRMGNWRRGHKGERNNCFSKIQLVGQKYRDKTTLAS